MTTQYKYLALLVSDSDSEEEFIDKINKTGLKNLSLDLTSRKNRKKLPRIVTMFLQDMKVLDREDLI